MPLNPKEEQELLLLLEAREAEQPLQEPAPQPDPQISAGESLLRGAAQGITGGLQDELSGLAEKGIAKVSQLTGIGDQETAQRVLETPTEKLIQDQREEFKQAQQANPKAALAGDIIGGTILSGPLGAGAGSAAKLAGRAATLGAAEGAARAEGDLGDRLGGAAVGGTLGAAVGSTAMLPKIGQTLKDAASKMSVRLLKLPTRKLQKLGVDRLKKIGDMLLDEKLTTKPQSLRTVAKNVDQVTQRVGEEIGETYKQVSAKSGTFEAEDIMDNIVGRIKENPRITRSSAVEKAEQQLIDFLDRVPPGTQLELTDVWDLAKKIERDARTFTRSTNATENSKGFVLDQIAGEIRDFIAERAATVDPKNAERILELNDAFKSIIVAQEALEGEVLRKQFGKAAFDTRSLLQKTAGAITGNTPAVSTVNTLGEILKTPSKLGRFAKPLQDAQAKGSTAMAATHFVLSQTDEEYRKVIGNLMKIPGETKDEQ